MPAKRYLSREIRRACDMERGLLLWLLVVLLFVIILIALFTNFI